MYDTYYRLKSSALKQLDAVSLVPHPAMTAVRNPGTVGSSLCQEALFTIRGIWNHVKRKPDFMHLFANVLTFPQQWVDQATNPINLYYPVYVSDNSQYLT